MPYYTSKCYNNTPYYSKSIWSPYMYLIYHAGMTYDLIISTCYGLPQIICCLQQTYRKRLGKANTLELTFLEFIMIISLLVTTHSTCRIKIHDIGSISALACLFTIDSGSDQLLPQSSLYPYLACFLSRNT